MSGKFSSGTINPKQTNKQKRMVSILMNPWIISTSEVQNCWFKSSFKIMASFCFKSYSFVSISTKFIYFFSLRTFASFPLSFRFPFRVLLNPLSCGSCMSVRHCHLEYNKNTCMGVAFYAWGWEMHDETYLRTIKRNSWCENHAIKTIFFFFNHISYCLRGPS